MGSNPTLSATLRPPGFGWHSHLRQSTETLPIDVAAAYGCTMRCIYLRQLKDGDAYIGSTKPRLPVALKSGVAVETESHARELESYFKSGSGKAVALKRLVGK